MRVSMKVAANPQTGKTGKSRFEKLASYLHQYWFFYLLALPGLVFLILFSYGPMYGLLLAFKDFNYKLGIFGSPWAGFKHFKSFLTDAYFWTVVKNTVLINIYNIVFGFTFTVLLALMLNELRMRRTKRIVQTVVYLPYFISWVIFSGLVIVFLDPQAGLVNGVLQAIGAEPINFLTNKEMFRTILVITNTIKTAGYGTIIYLAAIAGVNPELYESAKVDGANRYHLIRYITLPRIYPTIAILLILQVSSLFISNFDQVFNLYSPMVYETGDVISTYIYRIGLGKGDYSVSTAINLLFNTIGLFILVGTNKAVEKMDVMGVF